MPAPVDTAAFNLPVFYNIVNGERAATTQTFDVINPATGHLVAACPEAGDELANQAVAAAVAAFPTWRDTALKERRAALLKVADIMEENTDLLCRVLTMEQGKPLGISQWEMSKAIVILKHAAELDLPYDVVKDEAGDKIEVVYHPLGVFAVIAPWNFPIYVLMASLAEAIVCGNTVVAKPSPYTPLSSLLLLDLVKDVFPKGTVNIVAGGNELGALLVRHPDVAGVAFTGSVATGKAIARSCSNDMKRMVLEMGGNDAAIVREDVDIDKVADGLMVAAFINSGQLCCAVKRVYVHERRFDELCDALVQRIKAAKVGNGLDPTVQFGPICNRMQYDRVKELLQDAMDNGGKVLCGGLPEETQPGFMFPLTLVTNVAEGVRLVDEEQFGPVLPVMKFAADEEAIARANGCKYGLGASVWSKDTTKAAEMARKLQAGSSWVNQHANILRTAPFGGFKESGIGRTGGKWGLQAFLEPQAVFVKDM